MKPHQRDNLEDLARHIALGGKTRTFADSRKIPLRTVQRWRAEPSLQKRVREIRTDSTDQAVGMLCRSLTASVREMCRLMKRGKSEAVRLAAARSIQTVQLELRQFHDVDERIAAIETQLAELANESDPRGRKAYPGGPNRRTRLDKP